MRHGHVDAGEPVDPFDERGAVYRGAEVHHRARPERAVMEHVRIRDRQNDARGAGSQPGIEDILEIHGADAAGRVGLCAHAVVGRHDERRAHPIHRRE